MLTFSMLMKTNDRAGRLPGVAALMFGIGSLAFSQNYTITTVAGGWLPPDGALATTAPLLPSSVAVDSAGNLYVADIGQSLVVRIDASTGQLTIVAGTGAPGYNGDNIAATSAELSYPSGVAVDSANNLYIADSSNNRVRKVSDGIITTIAGTGTAGYNSDNIAASSAELNGPNGVAVDSAGNLYIADSSNNRIRKVSSGIITTVAGTGVGGYNGDNIAPTSAELNRPSGVALDPANNLYIADGYRIRKVSSGIITTVAGTGVGGYNGDNIAATSAELYPSGVALDSAGNVYIADIYNNRIRKVSNGIITTIAGTGTNGYNGDNIAATSADLYEPGGVAVDSANNLYIADTDNARVRKVSNGIITTVAGTGVGGYNGDNIPATSALLAGPWGVALDSAGNLYIADPGNSRIRKVSNRFITTVAGNGMAYYSGDDIAATSAALGEPNGVAVDSTGNVYIADTANNRIRKVSNGIITTVAGNGCACYNGDNIAATSAELAGPNGVAVDSAGNVYIADTANNRIRKISNGLITTVAGNGMAFYNGDDIAATSAALYFPMAVAVDSANNLYIVDWGNSRIRKVSNGIITTVAGTGTAGYNGDNIAAASAELNNPYGVAVDSANNLYIADTSNSRIRKVSDGIITTIAGTGTAGYNGDNIAAASAELNGPSGVAVDSANNLYIADTRSNRVRELSPLTTISIIPNPLVLDGGSVGAATVTYSAPVPVDVYVGESLFCGGSTSGSCQTGPWVSNGMVFSLVDPISGTTLATATARVMSGPLAPSRRR
jgi:trimeric autotransporter adhesin